MLSELGTSWSAVKHSTTKLHPNLKTTPGLVKYHKWILFFNCLQHFTDLFHLIWIWQCHIMLNLEFITVSRKFKSAPWRRQVYMFLLTTNANDWKVGVSLFVPDTGTSTCLTRHWWSALQKVHVEFQVCSHRSRLKMRVQWSVHNTQIIEEEKNQRIELIHWTCRFQCLQTQKD